MPRRSRQQRQDSRRASSKERKRSASGRQAAELAADQLRVDIGLHGDLFGHGDGVEGENVTADEPQEVEIGRPKRNTTKSPFRPPNKKKPR